MEIATPVGIVLALVAILASYIMEGGSPAVFLAPPAILLVLGGTLGVTLASNRLSDLGGVLKAAIGVLKPGKKGDGGAATVTSLMEFANVARADGLLALEEKVKTIEDPFLRRGLEMVIDGTDSSEVADALGEEIEAQRDRHKVAAKFFADMGAFAPTLGIIGTVLGLVHALEGLSDPAKLGHAVSAAFLATLWGVITANVLWLPISNKLKRASTLESAHRYLLIQGVLAIQAGISPRAVGERLKSHLSPRERTSLDAPEKLSA